EDPGVMVGSAHPTKSWRAPCQGRTGGRQGCTREESEGLRAVSEPRKTWLASKPCHPVRGDEMAWKDREEEGGKGARDSMKFLTTIVTSLLVARVAGAGGGAEEAGKLLEPKPLIAGHPVVLLFPTGHSALKALAGADQEEKFTIQNGRVAKVNNIHNPSIE